MRINHAARGRAVTVATVLLAALTALPALIALPAAGAAAGATRPGRGTGTCFTLDTVSATSVQAAAAARYWTPQRMRTATAWSPAGAASAGAPLTPAQARAERAASPKVTQVRECLPTRSLPASAAPTAPGTPGSRPVTSGYRTVGKLFFVTANGHRVSCTGTSIAGPGSDLVLAAAHCVAAYNYQPTRDWAFAPGWHNGSGPYGLWTGLYVNVPSNWFYNCRRVGPISVCQDDPCYDYAVVVVGSNGGHSLASRVGGDGWAVMQPRTPNVTIAGYPSGGQKLLVNSTGSSTFTPPGLHCWNRVGSTPGFTGGTSGGPWFSRYNSRTQTGTVIGDIGGYQQGGKNPTPSYSPYWTAVFASTVNGS
jgi:hypothetical protein